MVAEDSGFNKKGNIGEESWDEIAPFLKANSGWNNAGNGTDDYGFGALPGGYIEVYSDNHTRLGRNGYWHTSTSKAGDSTPFNFSLRYNWDEFYYQDYDRYSTRSIRCVKD